MKHLWLRFFGEELGSVRDMAALSGARAGSGRAPGSSQELALTKPGFTPCSRDRQAQWPTLRMHVMRQDTQLCECFEICHSAAPLRLPTCMQVCTGKSLATQRVFSEKQRAAHFSQGAAPAVTFSGPIGRCCVVCCLSTAGAVRDALRLRGRL